MDYSYQIQILLCSNYFQWNQLNFIPYVCILYKLCTITKEMTSMYVYNIPSEVWNTFCYLTFLFRGIILASVFIHWNLNL